MLEWFLVLVSLPELKPFSIKVLDDTVAYLINLIKSNLGLRDAWHSKYRNRFFNAINIWKRDKSSLVHHLRHRNTPLVSSPVFYLIPHCYLLSFPPSQHWRERGQVAVLVPRQHVLPQAVSRLERDACEHVLYVLLQREQINKAALSLPRQAHKK